MNHNSYFQTDINYWPINKAMYWWKHFDARVVDKNFRTLARHNFGFYQEPRNNLPKLYQRYKEWLKGH